jgi:serine/threonine-protein kinase
LAERISDGTAIEWDEVERSIEGSPEHDLIPYLRDIAAVVDAHREATPLRDADFAHSPTRVDPSSVWGHLKVLEKVGRGAFAAVYRAHDPRLERDVALKLFRTFGGEARDSTNAILREGRLLARIKHPNVVTVYGVDEADGSVGLLMEFIKGRALSSIVHNDGPMSAGEAALVGHQVCSALAAVHAAGMIHRDIKAQNVMREEGGRIVLMDFGIGWDCRKASELEGGVFGTPLYLAPELFEKNAPTIQSDVYSVGVLLYYLVSGEFPRAGASLTQIREAHRGGPIRSLREARPHLASGFPEIVDRALASAPSDRFSSAIEMQMALAHVLTVVPSRLSALPTDLPDESFRRRFARIGRRARWFVAAGFVIACVGLLLWRSGGQTGGRPLVTPDSLSARPSVGVLLFQNRTGYSALDWLRVGLADLLATDLAQSPQIEVVSAELSRDAIREIERTKGEVFSQERIREIGRAANVDQIIVGSFFKAGELLRVSTQLHDGETGRLLATYVVEGEGEASLFSLADQLSVKVRTALQVTPSENDLMDQELAEVTTASSEAFRYYAEGLTLQYRGKSAEAIPLLERAVEIDREFAMALTKLSVLLMHQGRDQTAFDYSKRAYENMARIPPRERFYVEGNHFSWREETYPRAIDAYRRVINSYPDHFPARNNLAGLYWELEYYEKATELFESMLRERPDLLIPYFPLSLTFAATGDFQRGYDVLIELRERGGNEAFAQSKLGDYLTLWGRSADATRAYTDAFTASHGSLATEALWRPLVLEENRNELDRWLDRNRSENQQSLSHAQNLAIALLYRGRGEESVRVLRDASLARAEPGRDTAACHRIAAHVLLERGDAEGALVEARLAAQNGAGDIGEWEGLFLSSIAHARLGRWKEATDAAETLRSRSAALLGDRARRRNHHLTGELALMRGETALAIDELEKAESLLPARGAFLNLTLLPDHVPIWFSLASANLGAGNEEQAARYFERIIESDGERLVWPIPFVRSLYLLATIYAARDEQALAKGYLDRAQELWRGGDVDLVLPNRVVVEGQ